MAIKGYSLREWEKIRKKQSTFIEDIGSGLGPLAGLTSNALAHLKKDWILWKENHVRIDIPSTASCNDYRMKPDETGSLPTIKKRNQACYYCILNAESFETFKPIV